MRTILEDGVEVHVRDQGTWRERRSDVGGRGLPIIEAYVDDFEITPSPDGDRGPHAATAPEPTGSWCG